SNADQTWPSWSTRQIRQGAVVEPASHTQAMASVIKAHQRDQYGIQGPGRAPSLPVARLTYAKAVGTQALLLAPEVKAQPAPVHRIQHRQVKPGAPEAMSGQGRQGVHLAIPRLVHRDVSKPSRFQVAPHIM